MAFPTDWNYYKEYDQPGTADGEQINYQVDITVEHLPGKMRSDFGDVRFTDEDENELYYHLNSFTESDEAHFIVKIPTLPTTGKIIRCYYGNPEASTTSDPESVYDLYHDLATQDGFTVVSGTWNNENGYIYSAVTAGVQRIKHNFNDVGGACRFDFRLRTPNSSSGTWGGILIRGSSADSSSYDTGYLILAYINNDYCRIYKPSSGTLGSVLSQGNFNFEANIWYNITVTINANGFISFYVDGTLVTSVTNTSLTTGQVIRLFSSNRYDFDELRISKYTANPPSVGTWGDEIESESSLPVATINVEGLPLVFHSLPLGTVTVIGLPIYMEGPEYLTTAEIHVNALPLEKWFAYTPSFFIMDVNGIILKKLSFESLYPGRKSDVQQITVVNNLEREMNMILHPGASLHQLGSDLDTYLSHYLSVDGVNFSNQPLTLSLPANSELDVYTYWQAPSTAKIGVKQWLLDLDLLDVPSLEGWGYVSWFTVTGRGDAIEEPYTLETLIKIDYIHGLMKYDFSDIRFALEDHTILKHNIYHKVDGNVAYFDVQLPEVPATPGSVMVYVYSGNPDAEDESDQSIIHLQDHFMGTELDLLKWIPNAVRTTYYDVNDHLRITENGMPYPGTGTGGVWWIKPGTSDGAQIHSNWQLPDNFDISWPQYYIGGSYPTGQVGIGLVKEDGTVIVWAGLERDSFSGPTRLCMYTEGVWSNVASGYDGEGTNKVTKGSYVQNGIFRLVKDGNTISIYYQGSHVADTTITTIPERLAVANGNYGNRNLIVVDINYLGETDHLQTPPAVGEVEQQWLNIYPLPVKADILYQSQDLPGIIPEIRYGCRIGDTLYE